MLDVELKEIADAKRRVIEGSEALWNARLQILTKAGDMRGLLNHLRSPVELAGDNCGCNSACGALSEGQFGVDPAGFRGAIRG